MRSRIAAFLVFLVVCVIVATFGPTDLPRSEVWSRLPGAHGEAAAVRDVRPAANDAPAQGGPVQSRWQRELTYGARWGDRQLAPFAAFHDWAGQYAAAPQSTRATLEVEGVRLARERRKAMRELIVSNPRVALELSVPAAVRRGLPPAVVAELETRVAGVGDYAVTVSTPLPGTPGPRSTVSREVLLNGVLYNAHVYGRRRAQVALDNVPLHGIAVDTDLALHESPARLLESGEILAQAPAENCPESGLPLTPREAGDLVFASDSARIFDVGGKVMELCSGGSDMIAGFIDGLGGNPAPSTPRTSTTPRRAADAPTEWTVGPKRVLVIRVDFSDFPGQPIGQVEAEAVANGSVRSFFADGSYGLTSLTTTVTSQVYRMPRRGADYATTGQDIQLHTDARNAAAANYTLSEFDRVGVMFTALSSSRVSGSRLDYAGKAARGGSRFYINGASSFNFGTVAHELGHTYGLDHANLWRVSDANPVSASGTSLEYGDPFDVMGSTSVTGTPQDARHHFSPWAKNRLGWLPDDAVLRVNTSGTYRVYRYDTAEADRTRPLAIRVFRDGVRWYWIGLRDNFTSGSLRADGAYVTWGAASVQQTQLLDMRTPGIGADDAVLPVGMTFADAETGVTIKPVARGGSGASTYLDVEITLANSTPPNVITSWGGDGFNFYTGTGALSSPVPETFVPFGLKGVQAVAGGLEHALALKADGTVVAWGANTFGQATVPGDVRDVVAIAANEDVSGAVLRDGTVRLWGDAADGLTTPPAGLAGVRQLSIGYGHALALKADGTVVGWGRNANGEATPPDGLGRVISVAAGDQVSAAVKADGTVVEWGLPPARWGIPMTDIVPMPTGLSGVAKVSLSNWHTLALKTDGTVVAWGMADDGQVAVPPGLNNVVDIVAAHFHSMALKADGTVVTWGTDLFGQTNQPPDLPRSVAIGASESGSFAVTGLPFVITSQPRSQSVVVGGTATFSTAISGDASVTYQWFVGGTPIPGATSNTLTLPNVVASAAGSYDVVITGPLGSVRSSAATLTVRPEGSSPDVSRISNLSIRTEVGTGAQTLIVGFVVGGSGVSGNKPLLLRGVGPTLRGFGVTTAISDPVLDLFNASNTRILQNDDWNNDTAIAAATTRVGAFPYTSSRDSAIFNSLPPGRYSAQVTGFSGATGIALAEIYDASDASTFGTGTPRLLNVSARTTSGTGASVLIAGFVITGSDPKTVLIRGIGPTLASFGVTAVLADPRLDLFNLANVPVQQNDNWGGTAVLSNAFRSVSAFDLQPGSRDAALLVTLQPGAYTVQLSGVNGTTGVALVEIYEMP